MNLIAESVCFDNDSIWVSLSDGRVIGVPLVWFPRLLNASSENLKDFTISHYGLHWDALEEDLSIERLLKP